MFKECFKLKKLDISNFNIEKLENANCMFSECRSLKELKLPEFWKYPKINMDQMFSFCNNKLKSEFKRQYNDIKKEAFAEANDIAFSLN